MTKYRQKIIGFATLGFFGLMLFHLQQQNSNKFRSSCPTIDELILDKASMDDECLVQYIAKNRVTVPSKFPYNLEKTHYESIHDPLSSYIIDSLAPWLDALLLVERFIPKRKRTFLECGALDGATFSTTLHLERFLNWSGILVEADPIYYRKIRHRNRKAYAVQGCASSTKHPERMKFKHAEEIHKSGNMTIINPGIGFIIRPDDERLALPFWENSAEFEVLCFPMYSILLAVNITTIDLFVLDVEGVESDVLKTIPFDKVDISVIVCEMNVNTQDPNLKIINYMNSVGYAFHGYFAGGIHPLDALFISREFYDPVNVKKLTTVDAFKIVTGKEDNSISQEDLKAFSAGELGAVVL